MNSNYEKRRYRDKVSTPMTQAKKNGFRLTRNGFQRPENISSGSGEKKRLRKKDGPRRTCRRTDRQRIKKKKHREAKSSKKHNRDGTDREKVTRRTPSKKKRDRHKGSKGGPLKNHKGSNGRRGQVG